MAVTLYSYHKVDCHSVCYWNYIIHRDLLQWWPTGTWGREKVEPICLNHGFWDRRFKGVNLPLQCLGYPSYCIILGRTLLVNLRDRKQYLSTLHVQ